MDRPPELSANQSHLFEKLVTHLFEESSAISNDVEMVCILARECTFA